MEQTEKYLNSILSKRLGSVINQSAFNTNANTVTRIPRQEEQVQSMPTVFRKQYETVLMQQSLQSTSMRITMRQEQIQKVEQQQSTGNHRVEYMAISKRLMSKKMDEYTSPAVDINKYQQKQRYQGQFSSEKSIKLQSIMEKESQQINERQSFAPDSVKPKRRKIFS